MRIWFIIGVFVVASIAAPVIFVAARDDDSHCSPAAFSPLATIELPATPATVLPVRTVIPSAQTATAKQLATVGARLGFIRAQISDC
jgi:hypothetical protein